MTEVNSKYTGRHKFPLNRPLQRSLKLWKFKNKKEGTVLRKASLPSWAENIGWRKTEATLLDALYRADLDRDRLSHLHKKDIEYIEREINKQIIWNNLALVREEGRLLEGYGLCEKVGQNREKVKYIRRYGMIFILEPMMRQAVLETQNLDLFIQDDNFDFHLTRYRGVLLSSSRSRIQLLFQHRLDFSITWTCTLDRFQPRQIFRIKRIYPCDGFRILTVTDD